MPRPLRASVSSSQHSGQQTPRPQRDQAPFTRLQERLLDLRQPTFARNRSPGPAVRRTTGVAEEILGRCLDTNGMWSRATLGLHTRGD